jgi:hypothetical protein
MWAYARSSVQIGQSLPVAHLAILAAIKIYRQLAELQPQDFQADLLSACHTLADVLTALGRSDEATNLRNHLNGTTRQ